MPVNLYDIFAETARRQPSRPAVLGPGAGDQLTYAQLDAAIAAVAERLERAGIGPGVCVGVHCPSGLAYIVSTYAVWRCGGCVLPLPMELRPTEKQEILQTIALRFVITERSRGGFLEPFRQGEGSETDVGHGLAAVPVGGRAHHPDPFHRINSAFIRFTSGTTGSAKGVVLSHQTILERITAANEVLQIGPADRVTWLLSMSYHFAVSIVGYLSLGAGIILLPNHFAPAILAASRRHGATLIYGSPQHYAWLAASDQAAPLPHLRLAISTTTALDEPTGARFRQRYGLPVTQALGIIEVGLPFINVDFPERTAAVGRLLPAYRLRLAEAGLGAHLGEVLLAGPGLLDAYYQPWQPRSAILADGWLHTGDIGELDADGCLYLRGRCKEIIDVRGMKFFPQEVEAVLAEHPHVASACVYARRDPRLGEVAQARVVLRRDVAPAAGAAELAAWCRQRVAEFKVPQGFEFVRELPRTASGKVLHQRAAEVAG
jgi:long-chain acyl-CoA synthetase